MAKINSVKDLFTHEFLMDILCTARYGSFWFTCSVHIDTTDETYNAAKEKWNCREDIWADCLLNGGYLNICDLEEDEEHKVGLGDIVKGFEIVMLNYPQMYANIREENYDLYDADAVIQCAVFGDLIYG